MLRAFILTCFVISTACSQGSLLLVGGGSEDYGDWSDVPYRWLVTHAQNRRVLVLNYSDTTTFFSGYLPWLSPCTVVNLAITSRAQANDSTVYRRILEFDGIFLRGGDQWQYVNLWRGTLTEEAIREVFMRGGVVGGTSAGEAVLTEIVFDAQSTSVAPRTALRNPLGAGITLSDDFLRLGMNMVCDSHFFERGRIGRLPAFMAFYNKGTGRQIIGVGVEYGTALGITPDGVGEVMGSGPVTILRYTPQTHTVLAAGEPLSMSNLQFDQLTSGSRIAFATGVVSPPVSASVYAHVTWKPGTPTVILDGGNSTSDWLSDTGSLRKLVSLMHAPSDTIGIFSSPSTPAVSVSIQSALTSWGVASKQLWINEDTKNAVENAGAVGGCNGFVLAGNSVDSVGKFLDSTTVAGRAFATRLTADAPVLFLGDDMLVAGRQGIGQMYKDIYGAYYGYLTNVQGIGVLAGMQCVPRLYENSSYIDNRASSVFWAMVQFHLPFGLLLDNGTCVVIVDGQLQVYGTTPALLIDAQMAEWGSLPEFHDPGKANPRQNGGILGGRLHIVRPGESVSLSTATVVREQTQQGATPGKPGTLGLYPNPFNASATIRYRVDGERPARVRIAVYDLLGREVQLLLDEIRPVGVGSIQFDGMKLASGMYFCRMNSEGGWAILRMVLMR
jgi:cyanophycinase